MDLYYLVNKYSLEKRDKKNLTISIQINSINKKTRSVFFLHYNIL